jgi:predicted MPP superfamily phosphohydrolase
MARTAPRFLAYLLLAWGLLLRLAYGAIPSAPALPAVILFLVAVYTTYPLFAFMRRWGWRRYPTSAFRLWVVRPTLYAQLLLPVVAGAALVGVLVGAPFGAAFFTGRVMALVALLGSTVVLLAGWVGSRLLVVREVEARVRGLPTPFDGLRIVQVSDLHVGPHTSQAFLAHVTRTVRTLRPDLVVVTGDLVDDRSEDARIFAEWLATLDAPAAADDSTDASGGAPPLGVYLIPGNHDVYAGWPALSRSLREDTRAHLLVNEMRLVERAGSALALVGIGDPAGRGGRLGGGAAPDVPRAFAQVPEDTPVVAFAHNPALWPALAARGAALTLSGHTHWGQLALPRRGWSLASRWFEHAMGAYQDGEALLYVHPGTGFWGIPFRLGAYPEVTAIILRSDARSAITMGRARRAA